MIKVLLLSLVLTACSTNPVDMMKSLVSDKPGLEVNTELVVGDKQEEVNTDIEVGTDMTAEIINNVQDVPPWVLILLVLGWFLPTPGGMWNGLKEWKKR